MATARGRVESLAIAVGSQRPPDPSRGVFVTIAPGRSDDGQPTFVTFSAAGPFSPSTRSNSTRSPSDRDLNPSCWIALWWTKQSFEPSSGVMKPNPLASLNHFTVPVVLIPYSVSLVKSGSDCTVPLIHLSAARLSAPALCVGAPPRRKKKRKEDLRISVSQILRISSVIGLLPTLQILAQNRVDRGAVAVK